jgi:2-oxoisovalerate ferredoxin oxidoreductase beta subunit
MSNEALAEYVIAKGKAGAFYDQYARKGESQNQTHHCPGCGHGNISKMIASAIDDLGIQDRTILINPVGCGVFGYYYFDVGNVQAAHGRAPAVATAVKRSRQNSIVVSYQGDGDLSAIGSAEILHAANRGENITAIFVNNATYSMTGGQVAPTTLLGQRSTTTPNGRSVANEGYPLRICELLSTLAAPVYIERVGLGNNKQIAQAARAIRRAIENQVQGLGFSLVEILSPCPTIWKMSPVEAQRWVHDVMEETFPLGVFCDRTDEVEPRSGNLPKPALSEIPAILDIAHTVQIVDNAPAVDSEINLQIRVAGFGGQGVLLLGEVLAEAGMNAGLEVSWLPSYGPEMRSGTSNCHVRLSRASIDSPMVTSAHVLVAMNEPSLRKFASTVRAGGWILYNGDTIPPDLVQDDIHILTLPFTRLADELGDPRIANMMMLGALLEITGALPQANVDSALRRHVKNARFQSLDKSAVQRGRWLYREWRKAMFLTH